MQDSNDVEGGRDDKKRLNEEINKMQKGKKKSMTADRSKLFFIKKIKIKTMTVKINKHCYFLVQDLRTWTS